MKVLLVTQSGLLVGLAQRIDAEGHAAHVAVSSLKHTHAGDGLVRKIQLDQAVDENWDLVICDDPRLRLRRKMRRCPMLGGDDISYVQYNNPLYGYEVMKLAGLNIPSGAFYSDYPAAPVVEYGRYVYRSRSGREVRDNWEQTQKCARWHNTLPYLVCEWIDGVEFTVGGWWNGHNFMAPHIVWRDESRAYMTRVKPKAWAIARGLGMLQNFFKVSDYHGYVTVDCVLADDILYAQDCRFDIGDSVIPMLETKDGALSEFIHAVAIGQNHEGAWHNGYGAALRVWAPAKCGGVAINGIVPENLKHIWLTQTALVDNDYVIANVDDEAYMYVAAGANLMEKAWQRITHTISNLQLNGSIVNSYKPPFVIDKIREWT